MLPGKIYHFRADVLSIVFAEMLAEGVSERVQLVATADLRSYHLAIFSSAAYRSSWSVCRAFLTNLNNRLFSRTFGGQRPGR